MFYLTKHDLALLLKFRTIRKLREILETVKLNAAQHQRQHIYQKFTAFCVKTWDQNKNNCC